MKCQICGEPMPPGEEMFNYHGLSGPCPAPPLKSVGLYKPLNDHALATLQHSTIRPADLWRLKEQARRANALAEASKEAIEVAFANQAMTADQSRRLFEVLKDYLGESE